MLFIKCLPIFTKIQELPARNYPVTYGSCHLAIAESIVASHQRAEFFQWCCQGGPSLRLNVLNKLLDMWYYLMTWFILILNRLVGCNFLVRLRNENRSSCLCYIQGCCRGYTRVYDVLSPPSFLEARIPTCSGSIHIKCVCIYPPPNNRPTCIYPHIFSTIHHW